jgi:glyoxylase-like metal-dependent hydrolase (beta-lactamase superfamily II)
MLAAVAAQQPARVATAPDVQTWPVQRNVTMLVAPSGNIVMQAGADGVLLVDPGPEARAAAVASAVRSVSRNPLHTIVNSHADAEHGGATGALVKMLGGGPQAVRVMAHDNVLIRLQREGSTTALKLNQVIALPVTGTYDGARDFFLNGEAVFLHHAPAAHTDGDTIVHFRGSDVIAAGDVFTPDLYPAIDLARGGSVDGLIAALNHILAIAVPARYQEGGTYIVPGHGRLCDEADVVEYRDMVTIIRDRVRAMIGKGMTLEQVQAARPSLDYDTEYGGPSDASTGTAFVESVYRSLADAKR